MLQGLRVDFGGTKITEGNVESLTVFSGLTWSLAYTTPAEDRHTISTKIGYVGSQDLGILGINDFPSRIHRYRRFITTELTISIASISSMSKKVKD